MYAERAGLARNSIVLLEQLRTLDNRRLREKLGHLDDQMMGEIDTAIAVGLGLVPRSTGYAAREGVREAVRTDAAPPPSAAVAAVEEQGGEISQPPSGGVTM